MRRNWILPLILLVTSLVTHFSFFGRPFAIVFDEVYYGSFVTSYATGQYYFDIHPPLGKLILYFFLNLLGTPSNVDFGSIGNALPWQMVYLRAIPLLAGVLLPIIVYYICRYLNFSKISAFAAGILITLENSLLVQSRFLLVDSIMLLFGFSAILFYLKYVRGQNRKYLFLSAILAAFAFSIKWTGFAYPLLIVISEIVRVKKVKESLKFISAYVIAGLIIYTSIFAVHFAKLPNSGPGNAFMTDRFQKTLEGNQFAHESSIKPKRFFGKFFELNAEMYEANRTLTATHDYSSQWYTWPLMLRPIFYWQGEASGNTNSYIYLLGNPIIYWLGILSIISLVVYSIRTKFQKKIPLFILGGFLVNFIPFIFIGRVMFLYHYEAALVFSIIALVFFIDMVKVQKNKIITGTVLILICLGTFIFFSPLTYGLPLNDNQLAQRIWLKNWR